MRPVGQINVNRTHGNCNGQGNCNASSPCRPLPFDENYSPKPAFFALVNTLRQFASTSKTDDPSTGPRNLTSHALNYESTAVSSPHYPACCNSKMPEVSPICLFRIPLTVSLGPSVLALAEGPPGRAHSLGALGLGSGVSKVLHNILHLQLLNTPC